MDSIRKFIEKKLKLKVNEEKSQVAKSDRVKFLGMTIVSGLIAISKVAYKKALDKVKELIPRRSHQSLEENMKEINRWYAGWANYFKMGQFPAQLRSIESHIRRRFRARIVNQQKRRRFLIRKLMSLGVNKWSAVKCACLPRKTWYKSHTKAVEQALPNQSFIEKDQQVIFSTPPLDHWEPINRWVKLT
jgi:RNA-directed DNA polymerase